MRWTDRVHEKPWKGVFAVPRVFDAISPRDIQLWGKHTVKLRHNLAEREDLFSDESLANLVETIDLKRIDITTMDDDPAIWGHVDRAGQPGAKVLDAVRGGRVWINLMAIEKADPRFADLLAQMYDELETIMPDFKTFKRKLGLLISSPTARVYYHFDVPGQGLWQIRGRKRIWIYPPTEPFLQPTRIENVVRSLTTEELDYQPWFDDPDPPLLRHALRQRHPAQQGPLGAQIQLTRRPRVLDQSRPHRRLAQERHGEEEHLQTGPQLQSRPRRPTRRGPGRREGPHHRHSLTTRARPIGSPARCAGPAIGAGSRWQC
jgi:hypothetical protein